jgi:membrane protein DedA with SNARE-associated domain
VERHLFELLARYGAAMLFFAQMFGIFGLPIPDEFLLTMAGVLVRRGTLDGPTTFVAAVCGCVAGMTLSYLMGRLVGFWVLERMPGVHAAAIHRTQAWFRRFGRWLLAFGYFVPGVRHVTAIAAGSAPLEFEAFAASAYPGAALWSSTFLAVGYYAGDRWEEAAAFFHGRLLAAALALGAAAVIYVLATRRVRG